MPAQDTTPVKMAVPVSIPITTIPAIANLTSLERTVSFTKAVRIINDLKLGFFPQQNGSNIFITFCLELNACYNHSCQNGECVISPDDEDSYTCRCFTDYSGLKCETCK